MGGDGGIQGPTLLGSYDAEDDLAPDGGTVIIPGSYVGETLFLPEMDRPHRDSIETEDPYPETLTELDINSASLFLRHGYSVHQAYTGATCSPACVGCF